MEQMNGWAFLVGAGQIQEERMRDTGYAKNRLHVAHAYIDGNVSKNQKSNEWLEKESSGRPFRPALAAILEALWVAWRASITSDDGPADSMR